MVYVSLSTLPYKRVKRDEDSRKLKIDITRCVVSYYSLFLGVDSDMGDYRKRQSSGMPSSGSSRYNQPAKGLGSRNTGSAQGQTSAYL